MALDPILDVNNRTPGTFIKVSLGVGPRTPEGPRKVLLYGNKTSSGSAAVETAKQITSEDAADDLFGGDSEMFQLARAALAANPSVPLYGTAVTESGGSPASEDFTFSGTATKAGTVKVRVLDLELRVPFASGDAAAAVATAVASAIAAETRWPVTASDTTGVVTVTANNAGPRGDHIAARMEIVESGTGITVAATGGTGYLSGGSTLDDGQTALDNVAPNRYHYHVTGNTDATEIQKWIDHVVANAAPEEGRRELVVLGFIGTQSAAETLATGDNEPRAQLAASQNNDWTPGMLAAWVAAHRSGRESADPAHNFNGNAPGGAPIPPDEADYWTAAEIKSLLNNGVTPLQPTADGRLAIVRSITEKSQDSGGAPDYRVLDSHKVVVPDFVADDLSVDFPATFPNSKLTEDNADGSFPDHPDIVTPGLARDWILAKLKGYEADGLIQRVDELEDQLVVEIADSPSGRLLASIPLDVIEWMSQLDSDLRQVG